jgi:hypothetical protein
MAVTSEQIIDFLLANPGMSDAQIATAMQEYNVTPAQMAQAVGLPTEVVQERYVAAAPNTYTAENVNKLASQILSQGTTEAWTGGLPPEKAALYMADELAKSGVTNITQVAKGEDGVINAMTGEKLISGYGERTGGNLWSGSYEGKGNTGFGVNFDEQGSPVFYTQGASSSTLKNDILKLAAVAGAAYGLTGGFEGLLGGGAATTGVTGANGAFLGEGALSGIAASDAALAGATVGSTGLTMAQLAQLDMALGGAGGTTGATQLANALMTGASIPTISALTGGSGVVTGAAGGITAESVAQKLAADAVANTTTGGLLTNTAANTALTNTAANTALTNTAANTALTNTAGNVANTALTATQVADLAKTGLTAAQIAQLLSTGTQTAAGLLQQQTSKDAAQKAQAMIDAETAAAKQAAQFRPVGMTTRFGTSQFTVDPRTGQLTSAGYTLDPQAKNAQDRFVALAEQGLQQAEGAQQQFAPLQTGAQNLFNLGNQYIAQSPQEVAQNYLNQQMALLQPGRETELANLQNKLQQQGRGGLSVSQGGNLGATTPELQALYNARAQQEAQLAANAQQFGQQQVQFGAGLLGTGAQTMGQYYGGQQAAYAPFTSAFGQMQALESAAQQPFQLGVGLGKESSTAGFNVGRLGLQGAGQSVALATGADATRNPYASAIGGLAANPAFKQFVGGLFGSTPVNALDFSAYGTGDDGYAKMIEDIYGR